MKTIFKTNYDAEKELAKRFTNIDSIVVAAFGISHIFRSEGKEIARTLYTDKKVNTFVGVKLKLQLS